MRKIEYPEHVFADFSLGVDWSTPQDELDPKSLLDAKNVNIPQFKGLEKRNGMTKLYESAHGSATSIKRLYEYNAPNGNAYVLTQCGTKVSYFSGAEWIDVKTGLTAGEPISFAVHQGYCYGVNGTDNNFKIRNTTAYGVGIAPPAAKPTVADAGGSGLTGDYKYVYAYKRDTDNFIGNYSPVSDTISPSDSSNNVTVVASADTQVTHIVIYRTLDLGDEDNSSTEFYLVTTVVNSNQTYEDSASDNDITTLADNDHTVPPKAKFVTLYRDRMIYANCPAEDQGTSLFVFSKIGKPEACPSVNYQYFDRDDGFPITGLAPMADYLVVFKKNKVAVMEGEFEQWYIVSNTIGCIAPWAIIPFKDKIFFMAEEGWKCFDGRTIYDVGKQLEHLGRAGYITDGQEKNYSAAYYPERQQMHFLLNHSTKNPLVMVGHFIESLLARVEVEEEVGYHISWTYHMYDNDTLTTIGTYTDSNGITRLIAGDDEGYVYQLDSGSNDNGANISFLISTAWTPFYDDIRAISKTLRVLTFGYSADSSPEVEYYVDIDHTLGVDSGTLIEGAGSYCGFAWCNVSYCGMTGYTHENKDAKGTGRLFKYRISDTSTKRFMLTSIASRFRLEGIRPGT